MAIHCPESARGLLALTSEPLRVEAGNEPGTDPATDMPIGNGQITAADPVMRGTYG
jgi:hypothetical protein